MGLEFLLFFGLGWLGFGVFATEVLCRISWLSVHVVTVVLCSISG